MFLMRSLRLVHYSHFSFIVSPVRGVCKQTTRIQSLTPKYLDKQILENIATRNKEISNLTPRLLRQGKELEYEVGKYNVD